MKNSRKKYSEAENVVLISQVYGNCPKCYEPLFIEKSRRKYKNYDIAHIYPLNPSSDEIELLKNEERLSENVNDLDNVIPLCKGCHGEYDIRKTVEEYRKLVSIKRKLIDESRQRDLWKEYPIEDGLEKIIEALYKDDNLDIECEINMYLKEIDEKLDETISKPTKRKIIYHVNDYYLKIRNILSVIDKKSPDFSTRVSVQIKSYYLKQKKHFNNQHDIFNSMKEWLANKANLSTEDEAEILVSFFVQNCEVFE